MKDEARKLTLQAASALLATGIEKERIPDIIAKWAKEWLGGND